MNSYKDDSGTRFAMQVPKQKRIQLIDGEKHVTMSLRVVLEKYGFEMDYYNDPVLDYQYFRSGQYDLVILDIRMPVFDGFLLYQKIKKIDSDLKMCFLNATEYFYEQIRKEHGFGNFKQELFFYVIHDREEKLKPDLTYDKNSYNG